jgi:D-arabinose 1-dehydrogenase-like Zn-dependent alcohol dehydrogenase
MHARGETGIAATSNVVASKTDIANLGITIHLNSTTKTNGRHLESRSLRGLILQAVAGSELPSLMEFARSGKLSFPQETLRVVGLDAAQINAALDEVAKSSDHIRTVIIPRT